MKRADKFYRQDETRRLIENYAEWGGDRATMYGGCAIAWDETTGEEREMLRLETRFPVIAEDASATAAVLGRLHESLSGALMCYHLSGWSFIGQAGSQRVSESTYLRRLHEAHVMFWELHCDHVVTHDRVIVGAYRSLVRRAADIDLKRPFMPPKTPNE